MLRLRVSAPHPRQHRRLHHWLAAAVLRVPPPPPPPLLPPLHSPVSSLPPRRPAVRAPAALPTGPLCPRPSLHGPPLPPLDQAPPPSVVLPLLLRPRRMRSRCPLPPLHHRLALPRPLHHRLRMRPAQPAAPRRDLPVRQPVAAARPFPPHLQLVQAAPLGPPQATAAALARALAPLCALCPRPLACP